MKKDKVILIVFLAIIVVSGGAIYVAGPPSSDSGQPQPMAMESPDASGQIRERIARLEKMIAADPNNLNTLIDLGNSYYDIDEPKQSVDYYERALAINPDIPPVLVDCGVMYKELGQVDKALEMFNRAVKVDPKFPQAYFNIGAVLRMEKGDKEGAVKAWKKYLELEPNVDPELKKLLEDEINSTKSS